ncbi:hypothetical protein ACSHT2_02530 [Bradyrhizobium sp. PUT101]|uniref:hypothetical protein n=1 Tax=Bradyrhizobium sp. PUT101 TaxID=3447427 RepID=UPI003F836894
MTIQSIADAVMTLTWSPGEGPDAPKPVAGGEMVTIEICGPVVRMVFEAMDNGQDVEIDGKPYRPHHAAMAMGGAATFWLEPRETR